MSPVERNLCVLNGNGSAEILIGGDSRAKYNLIPSVIEKETGKKCVNIAEPLTLGGDLPALIKILKKYPNVMASHPILVLSVNLESLNDLGYTGTPVATLLAWSPWDHLRVTLQQPRRYTTYFFGDFIPGLKTLWQNKKNGKMFVCQDSLFSSSRLMDLKGYEPLEGRKSDQDLYHWPTDEHRYLLDGVRRRDFEKSLQWLSQSQAKRVILYQAPFDTAWVHKVSGAKSLTIPDQFSEILKQEATLFPKILFLDFYRTDVPNLIPRQHFYDLVHLNHQGAEIFSQYMGKRLATP